MDANDSSFCASAMESETEQKPEWLIRAEAVNAIFQRTRSRIRNLEQNEIKKQREAMRKGEMAVALKHGHRLLAFTEVGTMLHQMITRKDW